MAELQPIQQSFESGEISERLRARTSSERYQTGLDTCENFIPLSHGPLDMRGGFEHVAETGDTAIDESAVVFGFDVNVSQTFAITIGDQYVQVFDADGPVGSGPTGLQHVFNHRFQNGLAGWVRQANPLDESFVEWNPDILAVHLRAETGAGYAQLSQRVPIPDPGEDHTLEVTAYRLPRWAGAGQLQVRVGTSFNDGSILDTVMDSGVRAPFTFNTLETSVYVTLVVSGAAQTQQEWVVERISVENSASGALARFASPYAAYERNLIRATPHPIINSMVFTHPNVPTQELVVDQDNNWTFQPVAFLNPPAAWAGENWPAAAAFFQQRLWLGGAPDNPTTFWGSKTGEYYDFLSGSQATDALEYIIARKGTISWISAAKNLVIGTENAEHIVTSEGRVIKPGDIDVEEQSSYGSFRGQNEELGQRALYVSAGNRKVRVMGYEWTKDAWLSEDLTWPSEHITESLICELEFVRDPEQLLWMCDQLRGDMTTCSYNREQNIVGWARHPHQGFVLSMATNRLTGASELWALVRYPLPGGDRVYLERYTPRIYLDSMVLKVAATTPIDVVTGLDHLEGMTVAVTVDDAAHPDRVVQGGQITLEDPATIIRVGLGFRAKAITLPMEGGSRAGTQQGVMKRYNRIFLRVLGSIMPSINGVTPAERSPSSLMNLREPEASHDIDIHNEDWDRIAEITVEQDKPFRTTIAGLFGEMQANKR